MMTAHLDGPQPDEPQAHMPLPRCRPGPGIGRSTFPPLREGAAVGRRPLTPAAVLAIGPRRRHPPIGVPGGAKCSSTVRGLPPGTGSTAEAATAAAERSAATSGLVDSALMQQEMSDGGGGSMPVMPQPLAEPKESDAVGP